MKNSRSRSPVVGILKKNSQSETVALQGCSLPPHPDLYIPVYIYIYTGIYIFWWNQKKKLVIPPLSLLTVWKLLKCWSVETPIQTHVLFISFRYKKKRAWYHYHERCGLWIRWDVGRCIVLLCRWRRTWACLQVNFFFFCYYFGFFFSVWKQKKKTGQQLSSFSSALSSAPPPPPPIKINPLINCCVFFCSVSPDFCSVFPKSEYQHDPNLKAFTHPLVFFFRFFHLRNKLYIFSTFFFLGCA